MRVPQRVYNQQPNPLAPAKPNSIPHWMRIKGVNGSFKHDQSTFSLDWDIHLDDQGDPSLQLQTFVQGVLGFASPFTDANGTVTQLKINRRLPAQCPYAPWLFASQISSLKPSGPTSRKDHGLDPSARMVSSQQYKLWTATVLYESPAYDIKTDGEIKREWERYTLWSSQSSLQFVQQEQGTFQWPLEAAPMDGAITKSGGLIIQYTKNKIIVDWLMVPDNGLFTSKGLNFGGISQNLDEGLGKINDGPWPTPTAYPRGTLLFESYQLTPHTFPMSVAATAGPSGFVISRAWDVKMTFSYFNPIPGAAKGRILSKEAQEARAKHNLPVTFDEDKRGHNLVPSPHNGKWYRCIRDPFQEDNENNWKYREYPFDLLFCMNGVLGPQAEVAP